MFTFKVIPDHGDEFEVKAGTRDVLVWEKTNRGRTAAQLLDDTAMVDLYKVAHIAARRQGLYTDDLKSFEETCELVETTERDGDGPTDPTDPEPSTGD